MLPATALYIAGLLMHMYMLIVHRTYHNYIDSGKFFVLCLAINNLFIHHLFCRATNRSMYRTN